MLRKILAARRLRLAWFAMTRANRGVSLSHLAANTIGPTCTMVGSSLIDRIEPGESISRVFFKGYPDPLYFPNSMPLHSLHMVLLEQRPWHWHYYEVPSTEVRPDDVVFDCGAAEGLFAFLIAPRARHVYAFEPLREFTDCLARTFAESKNVTVVPSALSDETGTAYLKQLGISSEITEDTTSQAITLDTIDCFCDRTGVVPTYLKADVEGFEPKLILGAKQTIKRHKPRIAITTYHVKGHAEELVSAIKELNPAYRTKLKGLEHHRGDPLMLHAW